MGTKPELAAFVLSQLGGERRGITCRKMFGEYGLHCFGTFFGVICDGTVFFKPTASGRAMLADRGALVLAPPYEGAKDYLQVDDVDDADFLRALTDATVAALPPPKPKRPGSTARESSADRR